MAGDNVADQIIGYLQQHAKQSCATKDIYKSLNITKKIVNGHLYTLSRSNLVQKVQDIPPKWCLVSATYPTNNFGHSLHIDDTRSQHPKRVATASNLPSKRKNNFHNQSRKIVSTKVGQLFRQTMAKCQ